jgi:hypothetical protein
MRAPSWLKEHHGLELRVAQVVNAIAHNPLRHGAIRKTRLVIGFA